MDALKDLNIWIIFHRKYMLYIHQSKGLWRILRIEFCFSSFNISYMPVMYYGTNLPNILSVFLVLVSINWVRDYNASSMVNNGDFTISLSMRIYKIEILLIMIKIYS